MKKIISSCGLVVLGAASVQAQYAPAPDLSSTQTTKPWSVSATLRGFYDDNYVTRPKDLERESFGIEVSPALGVNLTMPQTYLGLSYVYGMRYYEDRETDTVDHTHQASVKLSHTFTDRYKLDVSDSFVYAQEPELIEQEGLRTTLLRSEGDAWRNTATATLTAGLTERIGAVLGYSNAVFDYEQEGPLSRSSLLDRMEHTIMGNLRVQLQPSTVGILGYQFGISEYDDNNVLFPATIFTPAVRSDVRDSYSHSVYAGVDQQFNPQLQGSLRAGATFTTYDNLDDLGGGLDDSTVSPYVDANATWTYNPGNYVILGVRHSRIATDVPGTVLDPTLDQEATTVYTTLNHRITPKLVGTVLAQFQHGTMEGGGAGVDDESENFFLAGLNLSYEINEFLSAEAGYNFDRLDSDLPDRTFTRNRVYIGIRASY